MSLQYLKKEVRDEVDFLHTRLISTLWKSKFPTRGYYHYWWAWSSILKVLKVTSFQYLQNISKKKLGREFVFCMQINIKLGWLFLMEVARCVQSTQSRKLAVQGSSHVCCYLFLGGALKSTIYISRTNLSNELTFCIVIQVSES